LFLLFWVFETVGEFVEGGTLLIEESWIYIGAISSGILYFILKYLKKYTAILNEIRR
jgi:hypothetical protein